MERLYGLDSLRGVAALIVLCMHVAGFAGGHLAVDFFFMLSGYVMARSYDGRLRGGQMSARAFFLVRFRRLWPTMAVGAGLGAMVFLAGGGSLEQLLPVLAFALLMIPANATTPYLLNLPAWSIFYELCANAMHGALFARLSWKDLALVLLLCSGAFLAIIYVFEFQRILRETSLAMQAMVFVRAIVAYLIGILLFRAWRDRPPVRVPLIFGLIAIPGYIGLISIFTFPLWPLPFIFLIAPLAICSGLDQQAPPRISEWLGDLSFPLYALHFPIIQGVALAGGGAGTAIFLSVAIAFAWVAMGRSTASPVVAVQS